MNSLTNIQLSGYKFLEVYYSLDYGAYRFLFEKENKLYECLINSVSIMMINLDWEMLKCHPQESLLAYLQTNIRPVKG
jgi:hypothetical protein